MDIFMQVVTAVAVACFLMTKSCSSQPAPQNNLDNMPFVDLPDLQGNNEISVKENEYNNGMAICQSAADSNKASAQCRKLSRQYKGFCQEVLMFLNWAVPTKWAAICYKGRPRKIAGCLSFDKIPFNGKLLKWRIKETNPVMNLPVLRYCDPYKSVEIVAI